MNNPLTPEAQIVWDAYNDALEAQGPLEDMGQPVGAAIRAAAEFPRNVPVNYRGDKYHTFLAGMQFTSDQLLEIATELESQ